ncbi:MAG: hypothetical protein ACPG1Z_03560 [Planctomycetota bacterium]
MSFQNPVHPEKSITEDRSPRHGAPRPRSAFRVAVLFGISILILNSGCDINRESATPVKGSVSIIDDAASNSSPHQIQLPTPTTTIGDLAPAEEDLHAPRFQGLNHLVAGDKELMLTWDPAIDDVSPESAISYQVFLSERSGKQQFDAPPQLIVPAGSQSCRLTGLENGVTLHVVVRAVDASGKADSNEAEWAATPNPVLFVDASVNESADGETPLAALKSIDEAIGAAIGMAGVNVYIAEGEYQEQILLFDGMSLYGGFQSGFDAFPDPVIRQTRLQGTSGKDTLILPPGNHLTVIDGLTFTGENSARRAIVADDCVLQISHCQISGFADKGIQIETDTDDGGEASGSLLFCDVRNNLGDGLRIEGFVDLVLRECRFTGNGQSGISSPSLQPRHGEKTRLDLNRVLVADNGDIGINIRISEPDAGDPEDPPRVRLGLFGVESSGNDDHGMGFDLRYSEDQNVDMRIRLEYCLLSDNRKSGVYLDADAIGDYSISHSNFEGNRGDSALKLSGDATGAVIHVRDCLFPEGQGYSLLYRGSGLVNVMESELVSVGPDNKPYQRESTGIVTVQGQSVMESKDPSMKHWEQILESPGKQQPSHALDSLPAPPKQRSAGVVGIIPGPGKLSQNNPLQWKVLLSDDSITPEISAAADGISLPLANSKSGEILKIEASQDIGEFRKLILRVTVPEQSGSPEQSHRFEYELAGDR